MIDYTDREAVLSAVKRDGHNLKYVHDDFRHDREIVLAAVSNDGLALQFAHDDRKRDRNIVLMKISENSLAFEFTPIDLKCDYEIVHAALQQNKNTIYLLLNDFIQKIESYIPNQDLINNLREIAKTQHV